MRHIQEKQVTAVGVNGVAGEFYLNTLSAQSSQFRVGDVAHIAKKLRVKFDYLMQAVQGAIKSGFTTITVPFKEWEVDRVLLAMGESIQGDIMKKDKIIEIQEETRIGDVILEKGDRIKIIEGKSASVANQVKKVLDTANFPYEDISHTQYDVTVRAKIVAMGSAWDQLEDRFFSLFPNAEINGIDIYLEGVEK